MVRAAHLDRKVVSTVTLSGGEENRLDWLNVVH